MRPADIRVGAVVVASWAAKGGAAAGFDVGWLGVALSGMLKHGVVSKEPQGAAGGGQEGACLCNWGF